jgi:hypothetical protein
MPPRLAQKLLAGRYKTVNANRRGGFAAWSSPEFVSKQLRDRVLVSADQVGSMFMEITQRGDDVDLVRELPCVAPPFATSWVESRVDDERWGVFWDASELSAGARQDLAANGWGEAQIAAARWCLIGWLFLEVERDVAGAFAVCVALVGAEGNFLGGKTSPETDGGLEMLPMFVPSLLAFSLMHCKNVCAVEHPLVDDIAPKRERQAVDRGLRYYTLEVDPMRQVLRQEGRSADVGLKQALHLCRGHFKDYRQSGLFGRIKGIFWWDAFARGTSEAGVVVKDYDVKAPGKVEQ